MNTSMRRAAAATVVMALAGTVSACGPGYQDLPLPGTSGSGNSYRISATFDDALNLSDGALIKIGGLPVGHVADIRADGFRAVADMDVDTGIVLHRGATARLRYDTPLGEVFVEIANPRTGPAIAPGTTLDQRSTSTAPSVEDTLAEASLLVNGGGLTEIQTIVQQLNDAVGGREGEVRSVLGRANTFLAGADRSKGDLDLLLRSLAAAGRSLSARRRVFGEAIRALGPMARVLRADTPTLNRLLVRTNAVVDRTNATLSLTQSDLVRILTELGPILQEVLSTEPTFVSGMRALARADDVLGRAVPGDFVPLDLLLRVDLRGLLGGTAAGGSGGGTGGGTGGGGSGGLGGGLGGLLGNILGGSR